MFEHLKWISWRSPSHDVLPRMLLIGKNVPNSVYRGSPDNVSFRETLLPLDDRHEGDCRLSVLVLLSRQAVLGEAEGRL